MRTITENTAVSLSLLAVIAGGIMWLTSLYDLAESSAKALDIVQTKQESYSEDIAIIKTKLEHIEQILKEEK